MRRIVFALMSIIGMLLLSLCPIAASATAPASPGPYTLPYTHNNITYTKALMTKTLSNDSQGGNVAAIYFYNGTAKFHGGYSVFKFFSSPTVLRVNSVDDVFGNSDDVFYEYAQSQSPDDPYWFGLANDVCFTDAYLKGSHDVNLEAGWPQQPNYYQNPSYHCDYYFYDNQADVIVNSGFFVPTFRNAAAGFRTTSGDGDECILYVRAETDIPSAACTGEAGDCFSQAQAKGYATSTIVPRVGAIMVFAKVPNTSLQYGHVGIVTAIDGTNVTIQDSNWVGYHTIGNHTVNTANYSIVGYIYYAP